MVRKLTEAEAREVMLSAGLRPLEPYVDARTPWVCECATCGRKVRVPYYRVKGGRGCPGCGRDRSNAAKRLALEEAFVSMRSAGVEPSEPYPGSHYPWRGRCMECGFEVSPRLHDVRQGQGACVYCGRGGAPESVLVERMREAGLEPLDPYPGVHEPWRSKCLTCGNEVSPHHSWIRSGGGGCGFCAGQRVTEEQAVERMMSAGVEPLEPYRNTHAPWRCRCLTCGREVSPSHADVGETGNGCAYCSGRKVDPDEAIEKMRDGGLEPLVPYPGARRPWPSVCQRCGRRVKPQWQSVVRGQGGCVYCAGVRVDPEEAQAEMRTRGYEPLEPYPGSGVPWRSRHVECGREVSPTWGTIRAGGGGCRWCAPSGLNFDEPAMLYLVTNTDWHAAKIGVTGTGARKQRLDQHRAHGWSVARTWGFGRGADAFAVEQAVLKSWRADGYPEHVPAEAMPQGGQSETVALDAVSLTAIDDLVSHALHASGRDRTE